VDGMSGATLTAKGVNNMLKDYLSSYEKYLKKKKANG
jgi:Na+-transporting NADH:ubiquinone oxidoreductase subunit C